MFYRRVVGPQLVAPASRHKVRLLFGARQTGKTALLRHLLADDRTLAVNLQESADRRRYEADPAAFSRMVRALPARLRVIVVDEIQKVPALLDEVQALYDAAPRRWQWFLTGSSARRLRRGAANLLPGRSHAFRLHPVCAWELDGASPTIAPPPVDLAAPPFPRQNLGRVLALGCLPGVRMESAPAARLTLSAYVDHYLEEEVRREALVREMGPFAVFLRLAALESGRQINLARLASESGIAATTLKGYYQVLADTFVGHWMGAYARRARRRLLTTPRFYLFDLGVRNAAAEVPLDGRIGDAAGGPLLEHWVALELIARASYLGRGHRVSFWRTRSGAEVDFVWEAPREDVPIEVKWTARPRPTDARHVEAFLAAHPERARRGYVVCRCPTPEQLSDRVRAIPWTAL
ncbi:ATP-binding protein [bacterium]|nr:ATP-binding protein [bacterium]